MASLSDVQISVIRNHFKRSLATPKEVLPRLEVSSNSPHGLIRVNSGRSLDHTSAMRSGTDHSPFTVHHSRRPALVFSGLTLMFLLVLVGSAAAQESSPLIVDADEVSFDQATQIVEARGSVRLTYRGIRLSADHVVFDLRQERAVATGRVVLVDAQGRELRGERLTYDVRLEQAEFTKTETVVDGVHIRSERIETRGTQIIAHDATFTTCDPERPAYRITASRIEVYPGDRIVATRAALWIGRFRVFTLPKQVFSLKPGEGARNLPRAGYNSTDGLWVEYTYPYFPGSFRASLYGKYGTRSGFIVNNTLAYETPSYTVALVVGRTQNVDLKIFDLSELSFSTQPRRLGTLPLLVHGSAAVGWFRESAPAISTSRLQYQIGLSTTPIPLGPRTMWSTTALWQDGYYGNGARQGVLNLHSSLSHQLNPSSSITLRYRLVSVSGATPFVFDAITPESRVHDLSLQYAQTGVRAAEVQTTFTLGTTYYFGDTPVLRGGTVVSFLPGPSASLNIGYGERVPTRYHWSFSTEYNLTARVVRVWTDSGLALGRGTYFTIQAIYNTQISTFEDLDYVLTSRFCDCIDVSLRYRQVRAEIWLQVGLTGFR